VTAIKPKCPTGYKLKKWPTDWVSLGGPPLLNSHTQGYVLAWFWAC
jgi:hypothetical protein